MDQQGWNIANAAIALASAIAAIVAAWMSILVYRRQRDIGSPDISAAIDGNLMTITVDNSTSFEWDIVELRLGRGVRANKSDCLSRLNDFGEYIPLTEEEIDPLLLSEVVPIGVPVYPRTAGISSAFGRRDRTHITIYFKTVRQSLRFKLVLASREGRPRKSLIAINRTLPARNRIAKD